MPARGGGLMAGRLILSRREALAVGLGGAALAAHPAWAFQPRTDALDAIVTGFMGAFEIPGVAVALVRPGEVIARGYGVRRLGSAARVDADTQFAIASNSKSFVAAGLAMLVDDGRIVWDRPVIDYLPDFQMSDPDATRLMTVRDLLVHRSGLALGAGDLMQFPLSDHSRADIYRGLRHLPLVRGFRSGYAYDNILYVIAGLLIERISGQTYEDYITARLLRPLGMTNAVAARPLARGSNLAARHGRMGPPVRGFGEIKIIQPDESPAASPAGGIHSSANEIVHWLQAQLGRGALPGGRRLWSEAQAAEMWTPQVITASSAGPTSENPIRPVIAGYALGWNVQDYRGRRLLHHSGGLSGQITFTGLFPDHGLAFAVFTNMEGPALRELRHAVADHLIGDTSVDWLAETRTRVAAETAEALAAVGGSGGNAPPGGPSLPLTAYAGRYRDPWYGDLQVRLQAVRGGPPRLHIDFTRTPVFKSVLEPFGPDTFRTRFPAGAGEDAVVTFVVENGRVTRLRLRALSPFADFSYDFHDLNPVRVE
jgi:CubicO group peptidase (beta-lactamase class C family)